MTEKKLSRTTYRDPVLPGSPPRSGDSTRAENGLDMDEYYRPLEQVHGSGLHGWGVASGMRVKATAAAAGVRVLPGIVIDVSGHHVSLAAGGQAEVGANADAPGSAATLVVVDAANGALVPTAGLSGTRLVTVRFWETFDTEAYNLYGVYKYDHTPWLELVDPAGFSHDGTRVVLAQVTIDAAGNVTGLSPGLRRATALPVETVSLRRAYQASGAPSLAVDNETYGVIRPRSAGGIEIAVPRAADHVEVERDGGGSFAQMTLVAEAVAVKRNDGRQTIELDANLGHVIAGTSGVDGDVRLFDHSNRLTVTLDGHDALAVLGAEGVDGELRVLNRARAASVRALGSTGDLIYRGALKDPGNSHPGVTHSMLKDLTDGGITSLHKHDLGVLGYWGTTGTRVGIVSGRVDVASPGDKQGSVTIQFSDHSTSSSGSGFLSADVHGFQGKFAATPHAIVAAAGVGLSTYDDTYFDFRISAVSSSSVTVWFQVDGAFSVPHYGYFLVIGPL